MRGEYRIYAGRMADVCALVDYEDYIHFSRWKWDYVGSQRSSNVYVRRRPRATRNPDGTQNARSLCLHVEIMKRIALPPSLLHVFVDHINGDTLDCRRVNLRWATREENNANRKPRRRYFAPVERQDLGARDSF